MTEHPEPAEQRTARVLALVTRYAVDGELTSEGLVDLIASEFKAAENAALEQAAKRIKEAYKAEGGGCIKMPLTGSAVRDLCLEAVLQGKRP